MPAAGLILLRHNTAEQRRLVAYFLSAANIEGETDPEVLLYVTGQSVETARRRFEHVPAYLAPVG